MASLSRSRRDLYCWLRPRILNYNIQLQNSNILHLTTRNNDYARAELMLLYGANANTFLRGKTPLMRAIQYGSSDVLELLLSHKNIDLRMQNRERESVLTYAMKYGSSAGKRKLVKTQPGTKIRHEHDRGVLPNTTCKGRIGFFRWLWSMCNDLRVEVARGYGVKGWISLAKFER
jgi:hypothetical protein